MSKEEKNECHCTKDNHCGCKDGKDCSCDDNCTCGCHNEKNCGCLDGKECTCGENCDCGEKSCSCDDNCTCGCHNEKNCGCLDGEECTCGENCDCGEKSHSCDDNCSCGCEHEHLSKDEIIKQYEIAFNQFETALIKVDKELMETKKKAEENERLAVTYKKDLERFKERTKEQEESLKINAIENVADKLIPILDNFEQALKVTGDPKVTKGFEMIEGMLKNAVTSLGIEEIDTFDEEFNPNFHNAVSKIRTKDKKKNNKIASVYQKGYKMAGENGKVIRHSMVEIYLLD